MRKSKKRKKKADCELTWSEPELGRGEELLGVVGDKMLGGTTDNVAVIGDSISHHETIQTAVLRCVRYPKLELASAIENGRVDIIAAALSCGRRAGHLRPPQLARRLRHDVALAPPTSLLQRLKHTNIDFRFK